MAARAAVHGDADQLRASGSLQRGRAIHGQRSGSLKGGHRHRALVLLLGLRVHAGSGRLDRRSLRNEARVLAWLSVLVVGRGADCFWQKCGGANRLASSDWRRASNHFPGQRARGRKLFSASRTWHRHWNLSHWSPFRRRAGQCHWRFLSGQVQLETFLSGNRTRAFDLVVSVDEVLEQVGNAISIVAKRIDARDHQRFIF